MALVVGNILACHNGCRIHVEYLKGPYITHKDTFSFLIAGSVNESQCVYHIHSVPKPSKLPMEATFVDVLMTCSLSKKNMQFNYVTL